MKYNEIIEDICHIYLHIPHEEILSRKKSSLLSRLTKIIISVLKQLVFNVLYFRKTLLKSFLSSPHNKVQKTPWLIVNSLNTYNSLKFVKTSMPESEYVSTHSAPVGNKLKNTFRLSFHLGVWKIYKFFKVYSYLKKRYGSPSVYKNIDVIFNAIIAYEGALKIFKRATPKAIIFSNDHNFKNRALLHAAIENGIKTCYIQHASVSEYFPALLFDLSLLEGQDSLEKYKSGDKTVRGEVQMIGMPKYDEYVHLRKNIEYVSTIGICGNLLDDLNELKFLIEKLQEVLPDLKLIYRPHPRDTRTIILDRNFEQSSPGSEGIFDFLSRIDLLIASHTSTHLEATLMNIPSIYFEFGEIPISDYYGYVGRKMIPQADSIDSVIELVNQHSYNPDQYKKAKYYNDVIGTEWEGKSEELALKYIQDLLAITREIDRPDQEHPADENV